MKFDREVFLALALSTLACTSVGSREGTPDEVGLENGDDANCIGFDVFESPMKCVAWKDGKIAKGYQPTDECVRWDDAGNCTGKMYAGKEGRQAADNPNCIGFDSTMKCKAWKGGKVAKGYRPTEECVRWDAQDQCNGKLYTNEGEPLGD